jgi:hypothetical protein
MRNGWRGRCAGARIGSLVVALVLLGASPTTATDLNLWPLLSYERDGGVRRLRLFGPLFAHERTSDASRLALRPLFYLRRAAAPAESQFTLLYPLVIARWHAAALDERRGAVTDIRILGLFSIERRSEVEERRERFERRVTLFPFVFYRSSPARGRSLSVLPLYADLRAFFGYERIRMLAFPLYLRLDEPLSTRTWLPFPFVSWAGGPLGRGWRVWPLYGHQEVGDAARFRYVLWPLYIRSERHVGRAEHETREVLGPFYWRTDSPTLRSRSYAVFFTHTVDRNAGTETWGFPYPLWLYQLDLESRARRTIRLAPLYGDRRQDELHTRFYLWPLYRSRHVLEDDYRFARHDVLLTLWRTIDEEQIERGHQRRLSTLFPLWRASVADGERRASTLALLDALIPRNEPIQALYAPLWQLFTHRRDQEHAPRWSLLWDLVSSAGGRLRYPVHFSD